MHKIVHEWKQTPSSNLRKILQFGRYLWLSYLPGMQVLEMIG